MARPEKEASVAELQAKFRSAQSVVIADYRGLTVGEVTKLRRLLRGAGVELKVAKNTLSLIAARNAGVEGLEAILKGPSAMAFGATDAVAPAKVLTEFARTSKKLGIRGAVVQGRVVGAEGVKALAELPPKEVLLARMLGGMKAPISGLANVLSGTTRKLVYVLEAIRKDKEGAGA